MNKQASTAILIFSRTANEEAAVKTFHPTLGKKGNAAIAEKLIQQSVSIAKKTNLPVFTFYSAAQFGTSFGERLANSIESIFEKGFEQTIVIGNDCPSISTELLAEVSEKLQNEDLVLGPAADGGVYLIGLNKSAYQRNQFIELPWREETLQNGWERYAKFIQIGVDWLAVYEDIDSAKDFKKLLKNLPNFSRLRKQLMALITSFQKKYSFQNISYTSLFLRKNLSLRAPPF